MNCYQCGKKIRGKATPAVRYGVMVNCCSRGCAKQVIQAETKRISESVRAKFSWEENLNEQGEKK